MIWFPRTTNERMLDVFRLMPTNSNFHFSGRQLDVPNGMQCQSAGNSPLRRRYRYSSMNSSHEMDTGEPIREFLLDDRSETAHDWEAEKRAGREFYDDGTMSYFWQAHTVTCLLLYTALLIYEVWFYDEASSTPEQHIRRGIVAAALAFLLFGMIHTPDGPFHRPHPAVWRLVLCMSILYELLLIFLLFLTADQARQFLRHYDDKLGVRLQEKAYGGNCYIYDASDPVDPFHNIWDKVDIYVPIHFFGWWVKTLVLRDPWLCMVVSVMFEVMEYTLEHQLPNFSECWWDHWIMDALLCNGLGILLGLQTLRYLNMKRYCWQGLWNIRGYSGKIKRIVSQFGPHSWTYFDWRPTASLRRWCFTLLVIFMFLLAELNNFYLKFVLWVPSDHRLCQIRVLFYLFWGARSMRETFQYLDDPNCKRFGQQSWLTAAIIITEFLIVCKFDWVTVTKPLPMHVAAAWAAGLTVLLLWTIYKFYVVVHWPLIAYYLRRACLLGGARRTDGPPTEQSAAAPERARDEKSQLVTRMLERLDLSEPDDPDAPDRPPAPASWPQAAAAPPLDDCLQRPGPTSFSAYSLRPRHVKHPLDAD